MGYLEQVGDCPRIASHLPCVLVAVILGFACFRCIREHYSKSVVKSTEERAETRPGEYRVYNNER